MPRDGMDLRLRATRQADEQDRLSGWQYPDRKGAFGGAPRGGRFRGARRGVRRRPRSTAAAIPDRWRRRRQADRSDEVIAAMFLPLALHGQSVMLFAAKAT